MRHGSVSRRNRAKFESDRLEYMTGMGKGRPVFPKCVELVYQIVGQRYVFSSSDEIRPGDRADRALSLEAADLLVAVHALARLIQARPDVWFRIEAYAPLGPALKILRDAGSVVRFRLNAPPPLPQYPWQMPGTETPPPPPPVYASWEDYVARTSRAGRIARCAQAARKANRKRLLSSAPKFRLTAEHVWEILEQSRGRCAHCGSLALENRPSNPVTGAPVPWAQIGRRIGSLEHVRWRFGGGDNDLSNLAWSCLWCNTWPSERRRDATDHGGYYSHD